MAGKAQRYRDSTRRVGHTTTRFTQGCGVSVLKNSNEKRRSGSGYFVGASLAGARLLNGERKPFKNFNLPVRLF